MLLFNVDNVVELLTPAQEMLRSNPQAHIHFLSDVGGEGDGGLHQLRFSANCLSEEQIKQTLILDFQVVRFWVVRGIRGSPMRSRVIPFFYASS